MSANGTDMGQIVAMLRDVIEAQQSAAGESRREFASVRAELTSLRRDVSTLKVDVASLRQAVTEYHASVLGHGVLLSELEQRVRRIEEHLSLPPAA